MERDIGFKRLEALSKIKQATLLWMREFNVERDKNSVCLIQNLTTQRTLS